MGKKVHGNSGFVGRNDIDTWDNIDNGSEIQELREN